MRRSGNSNADGSVVRAKRHSSRTGRATIDALHCVRRMRKTPIADGAGESPRRARCQGAQRRKRRSVFVPRKTRMQNDEWAGLLASGSAYLPHLPASQRRDEFANSRSSGFLRLSSPVTAAGPQRIRTVFPILHPKRRARSDTHVGGHPNTGAPPVNTRNRMPAWRIISRRRVL